MFGTAVAMMVASKTQHGIYESKQTRYGPCCKANTPPMLALM